MRNWLPRILAKADLRASKPALSLQALGCCVLIALSSGPSHATAQTKSSCKVSYSNTSAVVPEEGLFPSASQALKSLGELPEQVLSKKEISKVSELIELKPVSGEDRRFILERIEILVDKQLDHYLSRLTRLEEKLLKVQKFDQELFDSVERMAQLVRDCRAIAVYEKGVRLKSDSSYTPLSEVDRLSILNAEQKQEFKRILEEGEAQAAARWQLKIKKSMDLRPYTELEDINSLLFNFLGTAVRVESRLSKAVIMSNDGKRMVKFDAYRRYVTTWSKLPDDTWIYVNLRADLHNHFKIVVRPFNDPNFLYYTHFKY